MKQSNIKIATFLNIGFTIIEFVGGALTNSLAITADALHDLGDSVVLLSSWKIEHEAQRKPDFQRSFGYRRLSLLAAFLNAIILLGGSMVIIFQVLGRLIKPEPVDGNGTIVFAFVGIIANLIGSLKLRQGETLNEKMLSWHLLEDVLGWVGILISGIVINFTGLYIIDPLVTIAITAFILWGVYRNSGKLLNVFLQGVPSSKNLAEITQKIEKVDGVEKIYDIHLWTLDGKHDVFSVEAIVNGDLEKQQEIKKEIEQILKKENINHATIELATKMSKEQVAEQDFLN